MATSSRPDGRADRRADRRGVLLVAGAAALWGTWSLVLRPTDLPATVTSPIVFALMGLFLVPSALRAPAVRWDRTALALLAAYAVSDILNVLAFFEALHRTTVAVATLSHYLAPVLIAVGAPWIDREEVPGARGWAAVATAGLVLVLEPWRAHDAGSIAVGAALGAASAVCYAANVFLMRRLIPRVGADRAVAYHALLGAALVAPFGMSALGAATAADLGRLAVGALVLGSLAGIMFARGLARIGSARTAVLTFAEPIVAVAVGWIAWGEALGPLAAAGAALILAAGLGVSRAGSRRTMPR